MSSAHAMSRLSYHSRSCVYIGASWLESDILCRVGMTVQLEMHIGFFDACQTALKLFFQPSPEMRSLPADIQKKTIIRIPN